MNKEQKIRSRTWKYFWKQKQEEIRFLWEEVGAYLVIILAFGIIIFITYCGVLAEGNNWQMMVTIMFWIPLGFFIVGLLLFVFIDWIEDNWKKAKKRAKRDFKE